ncbi:MAG: NRDE family protein [Proteobacteria bacterium]|nr:NRDE family protein [Pseudomonadota bacterium]
MCTVVILRRPGHDWPLILGANRDEMRGRPSRPPARHWPDRGEVVAGLDELAGGSWMGLNDSGVVACVLNRHGSLGPAADARSRGELVLEALDHTDAADAANALADLDARSYRSFNLLVADDRDAYWIKGLGRDGPAIPGVLPVAEGVSMLTAYDIDSAESARVRRHLPAFRAAPPPDPETGDWEAWRDQLSQRGEGVEDAVLIDTETGFGTVSSSLLALPAAGREGAAPIWLYAEGRPDRIAYAPVDLG